MFSVALSAFTLLRIGLLALVVLTSTLPMMDHYPATFDFSAWYAPYGWIPIACILSVAVYAFRTAVGGLPIYRGSLLND